MTRPLGSWTEPPLPSATDERQLLAEWRETYGGSTMPNGKPVSPDLEARTDALLAQSEKPAQSGVEAPGCAHCMSCADPKCPARLPSASGALAWKLVTESTVERQVAWIDRDARHVAVVVKGQEYLLTLPPLPVLDGGAKREGQ